MTAMSAWRSNRPSKVHQRGAGIVEYSMITFILLAALLTPWSDDKNPIEMVIEAVKKQHAAFLYTASVPTIPTVCCEDE